MSAKEQSSQTELFEASGVPQHATTPLGKRGNGTLPRTKPKPVKAAKEADALQATASMVVTSNNGVTEHYLTDLDVAKRFRISRPTVWRWCQTNPGFPPPKQISPGTTRWVASELLAFEAQMPVRQRQSRRKKMTESQT